MTHNKLGSQRPATSRKPSTLVGSPICDMVRGTGGTDFQNGNPYAQYHSLLDKLLQLPEETLVYPAHDYKRWTVSTIGAELHYNPRLQVRSRNTSRSCGT